MIELVLAVAAIVALRRKPGDGAAVAGPVLVEPRGALPLLEGSGPFRPPTFPDLGLGVQAGAPFQTTARSAEQIAAEEAALAARQHAQIDQAGASLNRIVPGGGTVVKALLNIAEALGLASPVYHFPENVDPYDWIASHHFDVLAVAVHGVLEANRIAGDQGPSTGTVHGPPETPLQGFWLDHSKIGAFGPGDHSQDQVRAAMPEAPPRGFGNPLPIPGAATWQEVVRNINEWPPPPLVDRATVPGFDFVRELIAKTMDAARLQDWRDAGGGKPAELRHPEQLYQKYPELAPRAPAPAAPAAAAPVVEAAAATTAAAGAVSTATTFSRLFRQLIP